MKGGNVRKREVKKRKEEKKSYPINPHQLFD